MQNEKDNQTNRINNHNLTGINRSSRNSRIGIGSLNKIKRRRVYMKDKEVIETLNDMKGVFGKRGHSQYSLYSIDRAISAI